MLDSPFDAFDAFGSPFGRRRDPRAVNGLSPELVAAFRDGYFRANGATPGFADLFTFARTGTATYVDSTGTLQTAADGEPRLGHHVYEGGQWVNKGLLIESEARTNLITHSEDFTDAAWNTSNTPALAIDAVGPDGETSAVTLVDSAAGGTGALFIREEVTVATATQYTVSIIAKQAQLSHMLILVNDFTTPATGDGVWFDLAEGTIGSQETGAATYDDINIEYVGAGWYRCSITFTSDVSDTSGQVRFFVGDGESITVDLDGTSSILIFGAELKPGPLSSYTPTDGSTATRAADTRSVASGDWPYSPTAMSWYIEGLETYADEGTAGQVTLMDARVDANNRMTLTLDTDGAKTGTFTLTVVNGGTSASVSTTNEITPGINRAFRVACTVTASGLGISLNSTDATAANAAGVPDLSTADVDFEGMGLRIEERMWAADIGAAGRQEVTA